jgi:hypothetical protein
MTSFFSTFLPSIHRKSSELRTKFESLNSEKSQRLFSLKAFSENSRPKFSLSPNTKAKIIGALREEAFQEL